MRGRSIRWRRGCWSYALGLRRGSLTTCSRLDKEYRATFLLGRTSASDDVDTEVTELPTPFPPARTDIAAALPRFLGTIDQVPPAFSAVKIAGQRAYALARQGLEVAITPRPVEIHDIRVLAYEYPQLELLIRCGSGTYVRSLGRDLAVSLGTGAVMSELTRTRIGSFTVADALPIDSLTLEQIEANLHPPATAIRHLPKLVLTSNQVQRASLRAGDSRR